MAPIHDLMLLLELETQAAAVRGALDDAAHEEAMAYGTAALQGVREAAPEEVSDVDVVRILLARAMEVDQTKYMVIAAAALPWLRRNE